MTTPHDQRDADIEAIWRENRPLLIDIAFRMTGSIADAEDVVQETFARLASASLGEINDVRGWLIVVLSRLCLDTLGSARVRHAARITNVDEVLDAPPGITAADPVDRVTLDDSVSMALLVVLQGLSPAERIVFVLHDVFQFSFDAIASIVGRTPAACRQLGSRARRHLASRTGPERFVIEPAEHRRIAQQFIAACAGGDLASLMGLLDPDVVGVADLGAGISSPAVVGREQVASRTLFFLGGERPEILVSQPINGQPGVLAFRDRVLTGLFVLTASQGLIVDVHGILDPQKLALINREI
jgi:RNA polymerase sigma-70 factor (ECF subfamily)